MYRDLLSTKGRKYGQRQSKLKPMWRKGTVLGAAVSISHVSQCCWQHEQPHEARPCLSTTHSTDKPPAPVRVLWPWASPHLPTHTKHPALGCMPAGVLTALFCKKNALWGNVAFSILMPSDVGPAASPHCRESPSLHSGELLPEGQAPSFLLIARKFIPSSFRHISPQPNWSKYPFLKQPQNVYKGLVSAQSAQSCRWR